MNNQASVQAGKIHFNEPKVSNLARKMRPNLRQNHLNYDISQRQFLLNGIKCIKEIFIQWPVGGRGTGALRDEPQQRLRRRLIFIGINSKSALNAFQFFLLEQGVNTYNYLMLNSHANIRLQIETCHILMMLIRDFIAKSIISTAWIPSQSICIE